MIRFLRSWNQLQAVMQYQEKKVEVLSGTNTYLIRNRSNLGHQEHPHLLSNHHIVKDRVSGSQMFLPTKVHPAGTFIKLKFNQLWYLKKISPSKKGYQSKKSHLLAFPHVLHTTYMHRIFYQNRKFHMKKLSHRNEKFSLTCTTCIHNTNPFSSTLWRWQILSHQPFDDDKSFPINLLMMASTLWRWYSKICFSRQSFDDDIL